MDHLCPRVAFGPSFPVRGNLYTSTQHQCNLAGAVVLLCAVTACSRTLHINNLDPNDKRLSTQRALYNLPHSPTRIHIWG